MHLYLVLQKLLRQHSSVVGEGDRFSFTVPPLESFLTMLAGPVCKSCIMCVVLQDLGRTAAEYATAVFIIAPKYPEDPTLADRYLSMVALSLGQYLQEAHTTLREKLSHTPNRLMYWITKGKVSVSCSCL